jgi:tRNA G26 N,N-dimethylase Trm1
VVNCPNCGTIQATVKNNWTIQPKKQAGIPSIPEVNVSVYECPKCKASFKSTKPIQNAILPQNQNPKLTPLVYRLNEVLLGLKQNKEKLHRNLELLESERSQVFFEIEAVQRAAESKASELETEISQLRDDISSLKELLGLSKESS